MLRADTAGACSILARDSARDPGEARLDAAAGACTSIVPLSCVGATEQTITVLTAGRGVSVSGGSGNPAAFGVLSNLALCDGTAAV